jgi:hypothetical protein
MRRPLEVGFAIFFDYAVAAGALSTAEQADYQARATAALASLGAHQDAQQADADQALRFIALLEQTMSTGRAHVAGRDGRAPSGAQQPGSWGWRQTPSARGNGPWEPLGERVGYVDGDVLYLKLDVALSVAQGLGRQVGERLPLTSKTIRARLTEHGLLAATDDARETYAVRRTFEGRTQSVLALRLSALTGDTQHPSLSESPTPVGSKLSTVIARTRRQR